MKLEKKHRSWDGWVEIYSHASEATGTPMRFSVFRPPQAETSKVPVLYWLSGLTCTEENFTVKAGYQRYAAEKGILVVAPDTSPRGAGVPGEDASYDLGTGAGFYVDATVAPWNRHYRMDTYVNEELPRLVEAAFPVSERRSIFGHSMGGHGALVSALRNPGRYRSVSAFSPICNPTEVPWGKKAFSAYLGDDHEAWEDYDATRLVARGTVKIPTLVDQGSADEFLETQLRPERLAEAAQKTDYPLEIRFQPGYDHSYFFISSFIGEHIEFHARHLSH